MVTMTFQQALSMEYTHDLSNIVDSHYLEVQGTL